MGWAWWRRVSWRCCFHKLLPLLHLFWHVYCTVNGNAWKVLVSQVRLLLVTNPLRAGPVFAPRELSGSGLLQCETVTVNVFEVKLFAVTWPTAEASAVAGAKTTLSMINQLHLNVHDILGGARTLVTTGVLLAKLECSYPENRWATDLLMINSMYSKFNYNFISLYGAG